MKKSQAIKPDSTARVEIGSRNLFPALVAVGGSLAAFPAAALELGEVKVNSSLGQPLRASIAFALAPHEAIHGTCVSLQNGATANGLPNVSRASLSVSNGVISIVGKTAIRDPLLSMRVNIRCAYTPRLSREYMLFVDPAVPVTNPVVTPTETNVAPQPVSTPAPVAVRRRAVNREPIESTSRYRVQPGDTLSQIAERIQNRPMGLWQAVDVIFDANPHAFIDDDPNKLKAGSWLSIPGFGSAEVLTADTSNTSSVATDASQSAKPYGDGVFADSFPTTSTTGSDEAASGVDSTDSANAVLTDLKPGDIVLDSDQPFVSVTGADADRESTVIIPDTALEGPAVTSSSPNVPTATIQTPPADSTSTNWWLWLTGSGLAVFVGLILFGRRSRDRYDASPAGAIVTPQRRLSDGDTEEVETVNEFATDLSRIQTELADDAPTEENLALDADLVIGTGLQRGADVDVAQDFGFAATTELDLELPEDSPGSAAQSTDIIPPVTAEMESILDSEVLPQDDDEDDYDMSVIVDATKVQSTEDITQRDLEAVAVDTGDDALITDDYTVSQEVDYKILEQDYEDEMTATQALNLEIARAAAELAERTEDRPGDDTAAMSITGVSELDATAQLSAKNDDVSNLDDTGDSQMITVNLSAEDKTIEMVPDDGTVEMSARESDQTIELIVESGKTGTKGG